MAEMTFIVQKRGDICGTQTDRTIYFLQ